jgi:L-fuculose-phosphate aldolase
VPFLKATNTIILTNHGTVSFGKTLEEAYWKTEILDAYCRILLLAKQIGPVQYLNHKESTELLDLKRKLGFDDPRFHVEDCDLCGNSAFREGYQERLPQPRGFDPAPSYPGYLQSNSSGNGRAGNGQAAEQLVQAITEQVMAALNR